MTKYVRDTAAGKSVSAWIIMKGKRYVGKVHAHYGNSGRVLLNVFDDSGFQSATAGGYGYDKFTAALSGLTIDGHAMTDNCGRNRKPGKGRLFPRDYKAPRGWQVANWSTIDAETGQRVDSYHWRNLAWKELGDNADSADVNRRAAEIKAAADIIEGYSDCYRKSGLEYLQAIGYTVIQVI